MILDHLAMLLDMFGDSWYGSYWYYMGRGDALTRFCHFWTYSDVRTVIHNIVLVFFLGVSGMACSFSRSNRKRGAVLMIVALLYTAATVLGEDVLGISGILVTYGVLHFLATCMLIYALVDFLCMRNGRSVAICCAGIVGITLILYFCYTPPASTPVYFAFLFPCRDIFGNPSLFYSAAEISPGDLFTLIPYAAFFFWGGIIAPFVYNDRNSILPRLDGRWNKPLCFVGRHALVVYLIHVPLMAAICALVTYLFVTPGSWGIF